MKDFKTCFVNGKTIDEVWFNLLLNLLDNGRTTQIDEGSYKGSNRLEFDFISGTIYSPQIRPLAVYTPPGIPAPTTDNAIEKYFYDYLLRGYLKPGEHYTYGMWINGGNFSQLEWIIKHFLEKGLKNNHCYITVGSKESLLRYDWEYNDETKRGTSECLRGIDLKIIEEEEKFYLAMYVYFRSWDLYSGFPENIGGLTLLSEYISEALEITSGPIAFSSKGLHCYDFQLDVVRARLNK